MKNLIIVVKKINGKCPVYKKDNKIVIEEGYKINLNKTDAICMHSICSIMPYYVALSKGISPKELGLASKDIRVDNDNKEVAYIQCLDPCEYTGGGTVVFEVIRD